VVLDALAIMLVAIRLTSPALPSIPISSAAPPPRAQETLEGRVLAVEPTTRAGAADATLGEAAEEHGQTYTVHVTRGSQAGRDVRVLIPQSSVVSVPAAALNYEPGDAVVLSYTPDDDTPQNEESAAFTIVDHRRWPWLLWGAAIFAVGIIAVAGGQGARALVGLASAVFVLWWYVIPRVLTGAPPVPVALVGCALIAVPSLLLTHGAGRRGIVPLLGVAGSLLLVGGLTSLAVRLTQLSGFAVSEEIVLLYTGTSAAVDPRGLLLAGMLIGVVGGLVDVTVAQAAAVFEFHEVDPFATRAELFRRGMAIGRAHVAAAVHTLVLAYAGAALPLLLLFALYSAQLGTVWNREMIVAEALRTVAGSLGLAAAMPLTTWLGCLACQPRYRRRWAVAQPASTD
jgi:uncharacterized membrane protein